MGLLAIAVLTALSPFRIVRLGVVHGESLGGVIGQMDLVLALRAQSPIRHSAREVDVFVIPSVCANSFIVNRYVDILRRDKQVRIIDFRGSRGLRVMLYIAKGLEHVAIQSHNLRRYYCGSPLWEGLDGHGFVEDGRPWIELTDKEVDEGWEVLGRLGLRPDQRIFCFGVRDSVYWSPKADDSKRGDLNNGGGSTQDFRNTDPDDYLLAIRWLVGAGFTVVRMGDGAARSDAFEDLGVIDYANSPLRSGFLDVVLFSQCHAAFFGGGYGLAQLALAFHKPVCVVNYRPFIFTEWSTEICVLIPSLLEWVEDGRVLGIDEMLKYPFNVGSMYELAGLRFVANTPEEIQASVEELVERVDGTWDTTTPAGEQDIFWASVAKWRTNVTWYPKPNNQKVRIVSTPDRAMGDFTRRRSIIGSDFLEHHRTDLLRPQSTDAY